MGPFRSFGNIFWQSHLPHPTLSATFISGPMHNLRHFSQWVHMGFPKLLDKIARGLLWVHRPISASLCAWSTGIQPPQNQSDERSSSKILLVAPTYSECSGLCQRMHWLSKEQGEHSSKEGPPNADNTSPWSTPIPDYSYGLHCKIAWVKRVWFNLDNHRSQLYQDANHNTLYGNNQCQRSSRVIPQTDLP